MSAVGQDVQNLAHYVYSGLQHVTGKVGEKGKSALNSAEETFQQVGNYSLNELYKIGKAQGKSGFNYATGTPLLKMFADAGAAMKGSPAGDAVRWTRNKTGSLLGDIDNFYHNADGTYNRYKVGGTVAAGIGIAGIAGYNMNN